MNMTKKIVYLIIVTIILCSYSSPIFAGGLIGEGVIDSIKDHTEKADVTEATNSLSKSFAMAIKLVRNIAIIVSVVVITILGVRYMLGSVEERSGYQKSFIPLIIGIIIVATSLELVTLVFSANDKSESQTPVVTPHPGGGGPHIQFEDEQEVVDSHY